MSLQIQNSIRWQIQAWHGFLLTVLVTVLVAGFYVYERGGINREIDASLYAAAQPLLPRLAPPPGMQGRRNQPQIRAQSSVDGQADNSPQQRRDSNTTDGSSDEQFFKSLQESGIYYALVTTEQQVSERSPNAPAELPDVVRPHKEQNLLRTHGEFRELVVFVPSGVALIVGKSTNAAQAHLAQLALGLGAAGLVVIGFGLAAGWWLANRAIRPIAEITEAANLIASGDLSRRINISETQNELGQLAAVLNRTFEQLEKNFEKQVQFTADASHELRTPISVILTQIQLALSRDRDAESYKQTLITCERATERMRQLVNSLLELARVDSGEFELSREECDLARIAREALEFVEPLIKQRKVTVITAIESLKASVDTLKLGQALINLLTNAIQHNAEGITIKVTVKKRGNHAYIRVSDNGKGIPEADMPHLFDRFYRGDKSRTRVKGNAGLGLAICKAVVKAHGGMIRVKSKTGLGADFIIEIPFDATRSKLLIERSSMQTSISAATVGEV